MSLLSAIRFRPRSSPQFSHDYVVGHITYYPDVTLHKRGTYRVNIVSSELAERRDGIMMNYPTNRLTSPAVYPAPDMSACNILPTLIATPEKTMVNQMLSGIHDHDLVPQAQIGLECAD